MTEYAWPATLRPSRLSFYLQHNTLRFVSPVTRATQVLRREGARWVAEASFDEAAALWRSQSTGPA
ncbi:MAG: hypothetical protein B7Z53_00295 [Rhodospirillales bacterium 12-71-4]|nr:MAG: hypothetical protein B7Z53_00295 [Rhodospirillales bacterium 12-71-4]